MTYTEPQKRTRNHADNGEAPNLTQGSRDGTSFRYEGEQGTRTEIVKPGRRTWQEGREPQTGEREAVCVSEGGAQGRAGAPPRRGKNQGVPVDADESAAAGKRHTQTTRRGKGTPEQAATCKKRNEQPMIREARLKRRL